MKRKITLISALSLLLTSAALFVSCGNGSTAAETADTLTDAAIAETTDPAEEEAAKAAEAAAEEEKEPELSDEVKLLMEIRDLLKK